MRWLDSIINSMDMSLSNLWEMVKDGKLGMLQSMGLERVEHNVVTEQQQCLRFIFRSVTMFPEFAQIHVY